jgi:hypothetical protein
MNNSKMIYIANTRAVTPVAEQESQQIMAVGERKGWDFWVLGQAPLPSQPVRAGDWLIVPVEQDSSQIPVRALERVQAIYAAGVRPKGFVVVHEAPLQLTAPSRDDFETFQMPYLSPELKSALTIAVGGLAVGLAALAAVAVVAVPLTLIAGLALVDPILVAVTEDGYWVEIDRWWS